MRFKKVLAAVLLAALLLTSCASTHDFREADWGMSKAKVSKTEAEENLVYAFDTILFYDDEFCGEDAEIYYVFEDDALVEAEIKIKVNDRSTGPMSEVYQSLIPHIVELYGEPLNADFRVWQEGVDESYKNDRDEVSLYFRRVEYKLEWQTETSYVTFTLNYKDEQINCLLYARDINYTPAK